MVRVCEPATPHVVVFPTYCPRVCADTYVTYAEQMCTRMLIKHLSP